MQKSHLKWATMGDINTRYFHLIANGRQRKNLINLVYVNRTWVDDPMAIKNEVLLHFQRIFSEQWRFRLGFVNYSEPRIPCNLKEDLVSEFLL